MKQRCLSIFLSMTLMASVIAGAIGVSLRDAKADPSEYVSDGVLYWEDFKTYVSAIGSSIYELSNI